jgi:hypothetical protein
MLTIDRRERQGGEKTPVWNSSPNVDNLGALVFSSMRRTELRDGSGGWPEP